MRVKFCLITLAISFSLMVGVALAYNLLGGRWTDSDVGYLEYYINGCEPNEVQARRDGAYAWNSAGTPALLVEKTTGKVGLSATYDPNSSYDGYTYIFPSASTYPYTGAFGYLMHPSTSDRWDLWFIDVPMDDDKAGVNALYN